MDLTTLDVKTLEANLKTFLKSQAQFKDYDFEGSNLSALIRILSLNTAMNGFYLNMVHAEQFLDSAQTRSSLVSISKELNYTPRSARSAKARLKLTFTGTEPTYVIEKGRTFSSIVKNDGLIFSVPDTILASSTNGAFAVETDVYEGPYLTDSYVVNYSDETQRFVTTNPNIDTRSLTVAVFEDGQTEGTSYRRATTLLDLKETDKVYFLQAADDRYEVVFGDGVVGYRPPDGSTVLLDYRTTLGANGNGARRFSIDFEIGAGVSNIRVETIQDSSGGDAPETNESIRYYAPRHFQIQERAVSADDYSILLKSEFPEIRAISTYGGEEVNPPMYGRVLVAIDISNADGIPESKRDAYYKFLKKRCGLTITPVFVEPKYTYVDIKTDVLYNINVSTLTPENVSALVLSTISKFADENLNDFESILRYSRLVTAIDQTHPAVVGNQTRLSVYKKIPVSSQFSYSTVDFAMPLYDSYPESGNIRPIEDTRTLWSSEFLVNNEFRHLTDDGNGGLWVATNRGKDTLLLNKVGTVDYRKGVVKIDELRIESAPAPNVNLYAKPANLDVISRHDTILALEISSVVVTAQAIRE